MSETPDAVMRRAEIWAKFETCTPKQDSDNHYNLAVLFARALVTSRTEVAHIERGEAVNLARTIRETDNIENVTRKGILSLVDAVLRMDEALRSPLAELWPNPDDWNLVCPKCGAPPNGICGWVQNCPTGLARISREL